MKKITVKMTYNGIGRDCLRIVKSSNPNFPVGGSFDFYLMNIAIDEGHTIVVKPFTKLEEKLANDPNRVRKYINLGN